MDGVVKVAADAGAAQAGGFGFEVERLADQPGFAQQFAVLPGGGCDPGGEFGQQRDDKQRIGGNRLVAAQRAQGAGQRGVLDQLVQRHAGRAARAPAARPGAPAPPGARAGPTGGAQAGRRRAPGRRCGARTARHARPAAWLPVSQGRAAWPPSVCGIRASSIGQRRSASSRARRSKRWALRRERIRSAALAAVAGSRRRAAIGSAGAAGVGTLRREAWATCSITGQRYIGRGSSRLAWPCQRGAWQPRQRVAGFRVRAAGRQQQLEHGFGFFALGAGKVAGAVQAQQRGDVVMARGPLPAGASRARRRHSAARRWRGPCRAGSSERRARRISRPRASGSS